LKNKNSKKEYTLANDTSAVIPTTPTNINNNNNNSSSSTSKNPYLVPQCSNNNSNYKLRDKENRSEVFISKKRASNNETPYYVNDIKELVRLPTSLSFANSSNDDYRNDEQIDPCIIHIVSNLDSSNPHNNNNNNNNIKTKQITSSSDSSYSYSSSSNHSMNKLIYVIPERVKENSIENMMNKNKKMITKTEYSTINLGKGEALAKSQKQRMEFSD
jgi:hypothetical protein